MYKRSDIVKTVLKNDRLDQYEEYIEYARMSNYDVISLEHFFSLDDKRQSKFFILRHDVDSMGEFTRRMFERERKMKVHSTYYFRKTTVDLDLIDEMIASGFDVGFHFETIGNYATANHISKKEDLDVNILREELRREIDEFETIIGHSVNSICSHGDVINLSLQMSNNALTEEYDVTKLGVKFEAYQRELYDNIDCHIMDNSIIHNGGFYYADTPISAIDYGYQNIVFLSHPEHWWLTEYGKIRKLGAIVLGKAEFNESDRKYCRVLN